MRPRYSNTNSLQNLTRHHSSIAEHLTTDIAHFVTKVTNCTSLGSLDPCVLTKQMTAIRFRILSSSLFHTRELIGINPSEGTRQGGIERGHFILVCWLRLLRTRSFRRVETHKRNFENVLFWFRLQRGSNCL